MKLKFTAEGRSGGSSPWAKLALVFGTASVYVVAFFLFYDSMGASVAALVVLPVVTSAWFWGIRAGLLTGLLSAPLNTLLVSLASHQPLGWDLVIRIGGGPGTVAVVIIGLVVGRLRDLSEQVKWQLAERQRIAANLLLLERAIASSADGVIIADPTQPDNPIIYVNPAFEQLTGYSKEEVLGRNLRFLQGDDVDQPGLTELRAALREGRECRAVLRNYRKDGSLFWNELHVSPVRDTTGRLTHFVGTQNDITELKLVEEAVRASEERFRQLADHVREVFWVVTPDWSQMLYVNPAYEEMWGRTCESLYRDPSSFLDAIHPEDRLSIVELIQGQQMEKPVFVEFRIVRPDGSPGWIWTRAFPIRSPSGKTYRIVGLSEEVTERKQAEEDIRKALAKERELGELKSRFISMASHEFRTPLSAILTSAELVEHHGHKLTEEKKLRHLRQVQASVKSMTQLLDDVLIIGKAEAGKLEFNPVPVDLVQFCYDLVEEVQLSAGAKHAIHFAVRGPCAEAYVDEKLLRQILANLLSNAIKYSPQGSRVGFEVQCENGQAIFKIQDEGIGIPLEEQARLFDTFHRATNVGTIPGTGLGLAIVKRSVDLHGGTIAFTSAVGAGTTFTVAIRLRPSSEEKNT